MIDTLKKLDLWIEQENKSLTASGLSLIKKCKIKLLGQMALVEAKVELHLFATMDVDAYLEMSYSVQEKFNELLLEKGKHYDVHSSEIWMPKETEYALLFEGKYTQAFYAVPEYVLLSKALKAPQKNHNLIVEYLSKQPSKKFFDLCEKYKVNLENFVS
jgi:hypothetical protein